MVGAVLVVAVVVVIVGVEVVVAEVVVVVVVVVLGVVVVVVLVVVVVIVNQIRFHFLLLKDCTRLHTLSQEEVEVPLLPADMYCCISTCSLVFSTSEGALST